MTGASEYLKNKESCPTHRFNKILNSVLALFKNLAWPMGLHMGSKVPGLTFCSSVMPRFSLGILPFLQTTESTWKPWAVRDFVEDFGFVTGAYTKANPRCL